MGESTLKLDPNLNLPDYRSAQSDTLGGPLMLGEGDTIDITLDGETINGSIACR